MEGIAFDAGSLDRRVEKAQVEVGVVADQDGAAAARVLDRRADRAEQVAQGAALVARRAQGVEGVDAVHFQ